MYSDYSAIALNVFLLCRCSNGDSILWSHLLNCSVWRAPHVPADCLLLYSVCHLQYHTGNCCYISNYYFITQFFTTQGLYVVVVYLFISLYTLTWKHSHDSFKEDLEPATLPEESDPEDYPSVYESETSQVSSITHLSLACYSLLFHSHWLDMKGKVEM